HPRRGGPRLADVPAPLRPRTHLPAVQTDPGLDRPDHPLTRGRRPLDLAGHRRLHPAAVAAPAPWPPTCAVPGNAPPPPTGSPPPASAADFRCTAGVGAPTAAGRIATRPQPCRRHGQ